MPVCTRIRAIVGELFLIHQDRTQRRRSVVDSERRIGGSIGHNIPCGGHAVRAGRQSVECPCRDGTAAARGRVSNVVLEALTHGGRVARSTEPRIPVVNDEDARRSIDRSAEREIKRILIRVIRDKADRPAEGARDGRVELQCEAGRLTGLQCRGAESGRDAEARWNRDRSQRQRRESRVLDHEALQDRSRQ